MNRLPRVLFIARDDAGCGFYRCQQPATFIKRMGLMDTKVVLRTPTDEDLLWADLVVMQEMGGINALKIMKFILQHKIPVISEVDDYIFHVSPHNISGYMAWNPGTLYLHRGLEQIRAGWGASVSTPVLAKELFAYTPNIWIVPNYLDKERWINPATRFKDGKIRIGWAGGNAHADDLKMISMVIDKIVHEYKGKVIFETMGMTKEELHGVFPMENSPVNDSCPSCGYEGLLHHFPGEAMSDYPASLASRGWDIALAPVIDNGFGNAKSDIKIKEYSCSKSAIIASPVAPYRDAVRDGASILFAESFEDWYNAIKKLIEEPDERAKMVKINDNWVNTKWIQDHAAEIANVYIDIITKAEQVFGPKKDEIKN